MKIKQKRHGKLWTTNTHHYCPPFSEYSALSTGALSKTGMLSLIIDIFSWNLSNFFNAQRRLAT